MNQEELQLYEAFGYYATEELFWSLVYLNNAAFHTPLKEDSKNKLISLNKTYATIISGIYPMDKCHDLVTAMANHNQLFVQYVETLMQGDSQTNVIRQKWKENGLKIANILNRMNPYWKVAEWSAMIGHEARFAGIDRHQPENKKLHDICQYRANLPSVSCRHVPIYVCGYREPGTAYIVGNIHAGRPAMSWPGFCPCISLR